MEERDDDENESAVRALNTAERKQAIALESFLDEESTVVHPSNDEPGPSDESQSFTAVVSDASSSAIVSAGINQPTTLLGIPKASMEDEDGDGDDGIRDELQQLRLSEILLKKELERANSQAQIFDQLSAPFLDATDQVCAHDDPSNEMELRAHLARNSHKAKRITEGTNLCLAGAAAQIMDAGDMDCVMDNVLESVVDAVVEGCQGYADRHGCGQSHQTPRKHKRHISSQKNPPPPCPRKQNRTPEVEGQAKKESNIMCDMTQDTYSSSSSSSLKDPAPTNFVQPPVKSKGGMNAPVKEGSTKSPKGEKFTVDMNAQAKQGSTMSPNAALGKKFIDDEASDTSNQAVPSLDQPSDELNLAENQQDCSSIINGVTVKKKPSWQFLPKKIPIDEKDMPEHIEFKNKRGRSPDEVPPSTGQGHPKKRPSLVDKAKAKSLSWKWMPSSKSKSKSTGKRERKGQDVRYSSNAAGKSVDSSSVDVSTGPPDSNSNTVPVDMEDPSAGGEGQEVEAFYQQKKRMTLWERLNSAEQHREWKNQLTRKQWLGVKRIYWVVAIVVIFTALIALLLWLVVLATSSNQSNDQNKMSPHMKIFPPYTQLAFRDPESPQSRAFDWLINDPSFSQYSLERKMQRFSIAVLYFSTNGPGWITPEPLLQYSTDECQWFFSWGARSAPPACATAGGLIEALVLDGHQLQGTLPAEVFLLTNLKILSLADNQLMSTIPSHGLERMTNLHTLNLAQCGISGPLPRTLGHLRNLEELNLGKNRLTGSLPLELKFLSNLEELRLQSNGLKGTIPGALLANMRSLKQLYLFKNSFEGQIPPEVGQLQALEDLFLYQNRFSSSLPSELGLLSRLQRLWADRNQINGTIPEQLGYLQRLVQLNLFSNELSGTIPAALGSAKSLEQIQLNDNRLTGEVPDRLCSLLPSGGDNDVVRLLSVDCGEVTCECDCTCPRPGTFLGTLLVEEP